MDLESKAALGIISRHINKSRCLPDKKLYWLHYGNGIPFLLGLMRNVCCTATLRIRRIGGRRLLLRVSFVLHPSSYFLWGVRIINFHFNDLTHKNKNNKSPRRWWRMQGVTGVVLVVLFLQPFSEPLFFFASFVTHFPQLPPHFPTSWIFHRLDPRGVA